MVWPKKKKMNENYCGFFGSPIFFFCDMMKICVRISVPEITWFFKSIGIPQIITSLFFGAFFGPPSGTRYKKDNMNHKKRDIR